LLPLCGLGNSYNQTGWLTAEQWRFLRFALVCDALFAVLAFWVFPVLLPLCGLGNSYNQTGWLTAEQWRFL
ncbi:UNVERIFIED_CONTAM: hypothetical protein NY603_42285, partial [Bacteroidetes bacterium 56_B9]